MNVRLASSLCFAGALAIVLTSACTSRHEDGASASHSATTTSAAAPATRSTIDAWQPRFGRQRPVIAVLAANANTELTDFVIPYGVLTAADVADVTTVSTRPGPITMRPALRTQAQMTIDEFDARHPQGADYVIVPALQPRDDRSAVDWIKEQAAKGGSTISICNGALTVAETGLMDGHQATSHWAGEEQRALKYPNVKWRNNIRYVADGRIISSSGVSASIPISIALVAAIAGQARAEATARSLGIPNWGPAHDSESFRSLPKVDRDDDSPKQAIGVPLTPGTDEIGFALTAEAYSLTGVSHAFAVSPDLGPVRSLRGMTFLPERTTAGDPASTTLVDPRVTTGPPAAALDRALVDIKAAYGADAAFSVARIMEYPGFTG